LKRREVGPREVYGVGLSAVMNGGSVEAIKLAMFKSKLSALSAVMNGGTVEASASGT